MQYIANISSQYLSQHPMYTQYISDTTVTHSGGGECFQYITGFALFALYHLHLLAVKLEEISLFLAPLSNISRGLVCCS
jgi:hypothetical protein